MLVLPALYWMFGERSAAAEATAPTPMRERELAAEPA
jgi:hypothetical protein